MDLPMTIGFQVLGNLISHVQVHQMHHQHNVRALPRLGLVVLQVAVVALVSGAWIP